MTRYMVAMCPECVQIGQFNNMADARKAKSLYGNDYHIYKYANQWEWSLVVW